MSLYRVHKIKDKKEGEKMSGQKSDVNAKRDTINIFKIGSL